MDYDALIAAAAKAGSTVEITAPDGSTIRIHAPQQPPQEQPQPPPLRFMRTYVDGHYACLVNLTPTLVYSCPN